jgi:hypothetical protein
VNRLEGSADTEMALGGERVFELKEDNAFILRGGYATGSREYRALTAGASYKLGSAEFDYAFNFPTGTLADTDGSHRIGFSYKVTGKMKEEKTPEKVEAPKAETTPLPEAPTALTAPVPVLKSTEAAVADEFGDYIKSFSTLLGYYVNRTTAGAPVEERRALLKEIKRLFGDKNIDMTYINGELKSVGETEVPRPATTKPATIPEPPVKPVIKVVPLAPTAAPKAAPASNPEAERAWSYYRQAVERGITDSERVEILENILMRHGEATADKVVKELEKVRKRLE